MGNAIESVAKVASEAVPTVLKVLEDPLGAATDLLPQAEGLLQKGLEIFAPSGKSSTLPSSTPPPLQRAASLIESKPPKGQSARRERLLRALEHLMDFLLPEESPSEE